jgi:hypothetical protein
MPVAGRMELFAMSAGVEATVIVSAAGGLALAALVAFGLWWFRPFRSGTDEPSIMGEHEEEHRTPGDR